MDSIDAARRDLLQWLRRHVRQLAAGAVIGGILGYLVSFAIPKQYRASTRFTVESDRNSMSANRLASFAAQLNIAPVLGQRDSPDYIAAVANSRDVHIALLKDTICVRVRQCETAGAALFGQLPPDSSRREWERLLTRLGKRLQVGVDPKTGIITASADAGSPESAEGVLRANLRALSRVVVENRESQARQERLFAQDRLVFLERQRRALVDTLTNFYQSNRSLGESSTLKFRERELSDRLGLWQELVQSVARQGELARLDEARDAPVITVVEQPFGSPRKVSPRGSLYAAGGAVLGVFLSAGLTRRRRRRLPSLSAATKPRVASL